MEILRCCSSAVNFSSSLYCPRTSREWILFQLVRQTSSEPEEWMNVCYTFPIRRWLVVQPNQTLFEVGETRWKSRSFPLLLMTISSWWSEIRQFFFFLLNFLSILFCLSLSFLSDSRLLLDCFLFEWGIKWGLKMYKAIVFVVCSFYFGSEQLRLQSPIHSLFSVIFMLLMIIVMMMPTMMREIIRRMI